MSGQEKTRKAIERKLEETEAEEKEAVAQEKKELFQKIRSEKMRVSRIRSHLQTVEEVGHTHTHTHTIPHTHTRTPHHTHSLTFSSSLQYEEWNQHDRKLLGYIQTRSRPPIFYLPAQHNSDTTEALNKTTAKIEGVPPLSTLFLSLSLSNSLSLSLSLSLSNLLSLSTL